MTADVELLPLPSWTHKADRLLCDTDWLRTQVSDYTRANVAHATAAKDAEIHRLRAELEIEKGQAEFYRTERNKNQRKAERLAEALREIEQHALARGNGDLLQFVRAALHPTAAQDAEIESLRAEVERLNRILGRIVEGDGDSTLTIRAGTDAFAAAREYLRPNT